MTTERDLLFERQKLAEDFFASDASQIFTRLKVYDIGYRVFLMNYQDWERVVASRMPTTPMEWAKLNQDHSWVEPYIIDVTRVLHNYVASALTLVDTTRVLYRELYQPTNLLPDYQNEIDTRFIKDGVAQFVKDLRQFCQHYRLPLVTATVGFKQTPEGGELSLCVPLSLKQVNLWSGWSATSKAFIKTFENDSEIDLENVLTQYRDKIVAFSDWFLAKQQIIHADAVTHCAEVRAKMAEITGQIAAMKEQQSPS